MRRLFLVLAGVSLALMGCAADEPSTGEEPRVPSPDPSSPTTTPDSSPTVPPTEAPPLAWGPTQAEYDQAAAIVADLPVESQAGQVIVAKYPGLEPPTALVDELGLGGVILMGDNVASPEQVSSVTAALQESAGRAYPLMIGVDQEGGTVARVTAPATEFPSYMTLGAAGDPDLATEVARASGDELRAMGFTMVFAPDADVTSGPDDPTIRTRSASSDPQVVADIVSASLTGYADAGIVAVPKHFPGHGSVPADSHEELPVQAADAATLAARDFVPFQAAVDAGASAVMVAHIDVQSVDPGVPSSLSPKVIGMLRTDLGFDGLVVTDAQDMAAITNTYGGGDAAVGALAAGADVVLMPGDAAAARDAIVAGVAAGTLPAERLAEAATRGIALMLHQAAVAEAPDPSLIGSNDELSYEESLAGMTVVQGTCGTPLVGSSIQVAGGTETDRARLSSAAEAAGLTVGAGEVVQLLSGAEPAAGDVVVALDAPYPLGTSEATTARIALYGRTPAAFRALVDVLQGSATAGGTLPVTVDGVDQTGCGTLSVEVD